MDEALVEDARLALESLDDEVESDGELTDLVDNFEVIASAFDQLLFRTRRARFRRFVRKPRQLPAVLRAIAKLKETEKKEANEGKEKKGKELEEKGFKDLARRVQRLTKKIRKADYDGFDLDTSDLIGDANDLRENLHTSLATLLPPPEAPDATDDDDPA